LRLKLLNRQSIGHHDLFLLSETNTSIVETENTNAVAVYVNELILLYQEKYVFIPEYIIEESDDNLLDYLALSFQFVDKATHTRALLETEDQLMCFNQIIENNHLLDQYYFCAAKPNV